MERPDTIKERLRVLRLLSKEDANLELPLQNAALVAMVREGKIAIVRTYVSQWGGCSHEIAQLRISSAGRDFLARESSSP